LLGKHGLKLRTQVINIYVTGERPKDFIEFTTIVLKKPNTKKCSDCCTYSNDSNKDT